jgi:hypothetical protein
MKLDRIESSYRVRVEAAEQARLRSHPTHKANADEERYGFAHYLMSFTKGLEHHETLGVVSDPTHFKAFRTCIDEGFAEPFTSRLYVPTDEKRRQWEARTCRYSLIENTESRSRCLGTGVYSLPVLWGKTCT